MSTGKVILGAAAGLAIGAALGVLFAPDKGANIRKKIAEKGNDYASDLKNKYNGAIDSITSKLDGMERKGENLYEEGRAIADNVTTTV
ncbi:YtxH domain-containing protein [Flavobacterium selenitireducens]|uniref:YtxH domain-containing protein n=1 Tax=Flavobacterium selenitireducens TaxID=2722704 RepID=UPI00168C101D|nr:YtxH domain-containing protein [Flavobacterium selenitireducens]MBD3581101.1 YtxH domain-containing protein [Flavobacterium selenitireducens]